MSWLSNATGIHISGKGVRIEPKKALLTALGVGIPALGIAGKLGTAFGAASKLGKLGKIGGAVKTAGGFLAKHKKDIADYGALGEGVYDRMQENRAAGEMQNRYRSLQPLRDQAFAQLQAPTPDVHSLFAEQPVQPTRYRRIGARGGY